MFGLELLEKKHFVLPRPDYDMGHLEVAAREPIRLPACILITSNGAHLG